jgi:hypothetical protein
MMIFASTCLGVADTGGQRVSILVWQFIG